jgi:hypothetical protein
MAEEPMTDEELDDIAAVSAMAMAELDRHTDIEARLQDVLRRARSDPEQDTHRAS